MVLAFGMPGSEPARAASLPPLPASWPATSLQLGMADGAGGAAKMKQTAPFKFRYQYLAGGANTGGGWANWNTSGQFVTYYVQDSNANGMTPVFTYYMLAQSAPGNSQGDKNGVLTNLANASTMAAYWNDMKLFFQRAGAAGTPVVFHVEPDLWGFTQQRATGDNAATVPAKVGSSGVPELAGLPDNMAGFAQAVKRLRDTYAPNVVLGYHLSTWGAGTDIAISNPPNATVDALATRSAAYFKSLNTAFDVAFAEFSDRDAAFKQYRYGDGGASWWDAADFERNTRFLGKFVELTQKRIVMWQIPLGNTKMRAMNNTWNHYQDNRVEWLLDEPARTHLQAYANAGVVAFLFGRGADGATCACDSNADGVTNPAPTNGNTLTSLSADDDGGFFRQKVAAYYATGAVPLPGAGSTTATATPTRTATSVATATRTPTSAAAVTRTATPAPATATPTRTVTPAAASWTTSGLAVPSAVSRGGTERVTISVRSNLAATALVDIEIYDPAGKRVSQRVFDRQSFAAGVSRSFTASWVVPAGAPRGTYVVKVGIFKPGWGALYHWNNRAVTFTVK